MRTMYGLTATKVGRVLSCVALGDADTQVGAKAAIKRRSDTALARVIRAAE